MLARGPGVLNRRTPLPIPAPVGARRRHRNAASPANHGDARSMTGKRAAETIFTGGSMGGGAAAGVDIHGCRAAGANPAFPMAMPPFMPS